MATPNLEEFYKNLLNMGGAAGNIGAKLGGMGSARTSGKTAQIAAGQRGTMNYGIWQDMLKALMSSSAGSAQRMSGPEPGSGGTSISGSPNGAAGGGLSMNWDEKGTVGDGRTSYVDTERKDARWLDNPEVEDWRKASMAGRTPKPWAHLSEGAGQGAGFGGGSFFDFLNNMMSGGQGFNFNSENMGQSVRYPKGYQGRGGVR